MQSILSDANVYLVENYLDQVAATSLLKQAKLLPFTPYAGRAGRQHAVFGDDYAFSGKVHAGIKPPAWLDTLMADINRQFAIQLNSCYANWYPDGKASLGYHTDREPQLVRGAPVVSLSLGASTNFWFKRFDDNREKGFLLNAGTLVIMAERSQTKYLHAVKAEPNRGERISLTFRQMR